MFAVKVENLDVLMKRLNAAGQKQIRFAIALGLTRTAQQCQEVLRGKLGSSFTIRTPWVSKGIRIKKADKKSSTLSAEVGSRDQFMARQKTGGEKTMLTGRSMGIPFAARPTAKSVVRRSMWPSALLKKRNFYVSPLRLGDPNSPSAIWKNVNGKGVLYYIMAKSVEIPKRWPFDEQVIATLDRVWNTNLIDAVNFAFKTAK